MSKKLEAKNALIAMPVSSKQPNSEQNASQPIRTRTAVGGMAQFVATQSPAHREAAELRERIKEFENADLVKTIAPEAIAPSGWSNRHTDSFMSSEFAAFKREIFEAGGNVQPIKVRPLNGSTGTPGQGVKYEIVFGHRRHRACLELNIPVKAMIEEIGDQELFVQMERENRGRKNLSAWEQGCMYLAALDKGLYPSLRKLADAISVDVSIISKSVALAKLPKPIIDAFPSPLDIQFRWAQPLGEALQRDHNGVLARAKKVKAASGDKVVTAGEVFAQLIETTIEALAPIQPSEIQKQGKRVGEVSFDAKGKVLLKLDANTLTPDRREAFVRMIEEFLTKG